jgi:NADH dehydrogenase [ubiquinone] 1 alpha subcomplex assembly factor 7
MSLGAELTRLIRASGPITIAHYMSEALANPRLGYYTTRDPLGAAGDFITAPEVSQMFGEMIGLWCVDLWERLGRPARFHLAEAGPGRGTLIRDALRAARLEPAFATAAHLHLIEVSPTLRAVQAEALAGVAVGGGPAWHAEFAAVPDDAPVILVSNEFLDALPIHQYQRTLHGWRERLVDCAGENAFRVVLAAEPPEDLRHLPDALAGAPIGAVAEVSPAAHALIEQIARRVAAAGGAALMIDIGRTESAPGETLQAVKRHAGHPVFERPGEADLAAYVDFAALLASARAAGARTFGPTTQGAFLEALGIAARADRLQAGKPLTPAARVAVERRRLVDADQMGALFKVVAIAEPELAALAGFAAPP